MKHNLWNTPPLSQQIESVILDNMRLFESCLTMNPVPIKKLVMFAIERNKGRDPAAIRDLIHKRIEFHRNYRSVK